MKLEIDIKANHLSIFELDPQSHKHKYIAIFKLISGYSYAFNINVKTKSWEPINGEFAKVLAHLDSQDGFQIDLTNMEKPTLFKDSKLFRGQVQVRDPVMYIRDDHWLNILRLSV